MVNVVKNGVRTLTGLGRAVKTFAHGVVGGLSSTLSGGSFSKAFLSTGVVQALSPGIGSVGFRGATANTNTFLRVGAAAAVGGIGARLVGGRFGEGAYIGAFSRWFNDELHARYSEQREYFERRQPTIVTKIVGNNVYHLTTYSAGCLDCLIYGQSYANDSEYRAYVQAEQFQSHQQLGTMLTVASALPGLAGDVAVIGAALLSANTVFSTGNVYYLAAPVLSWPWSLLNVRWSNLLGATAGLSIDQLFNPNQANRQ